MKQEVQHSVQSIIQTWLAVAIEILLGSLLYGGLSALGIAQSVSWPIAFAFTFLLILLGIMFAHRREQHVVVRLLRRLQVYLQAIQLLFTFIRTGPTISSALPAAIVQTPPSSLDMLGLLHESSREAAAGTNNAFRVVSLARTLIEQFASEIDSLEFFETVPALVASSDRESNIRLSVLAASYLLERRNQVQQERNSHLDVLQASLQQIIGIQRNVPFPASGTLSPLLSPQSDSVVLRQALANYFREQSIVESGNATFFKTLARTFTELSLSVAVRDDIDLFRYLSIYMTERVDSERARAGLAAKLIDHLVAEGLIPQSNQELMHDLQAEQLRTEASLRSLGQLEKYIQQQRNNEDRLQYTSRALAQAFNEQSELVQQGTAFLQTLTDLMETQGILEQENVELLRSFARSLIKQQSAIESERASLLSSLAEMFSKLAEIEIANANRYEKFAHSKPSNVGENAAVLLQALAKSFARQGDLESTSGLLFESLAQTLQDHGKFEKERASQLGAIADHLPEGAL